MPNLPRTSRKLLSRVNGKPHATQNDHADPLPSDAVTSDSPAPASRKEKDEDIYRDPESSDEENGATAVPQTANGFKLPRQESVAEDVAVKPAQFKAPRKPDSPASAGSKRSSDASSDNDSMLFSSQGSGKRRKTSQLGNIHAPARPKAGGQYGKAAQRQAQRAEKGVGFRAPRKENMKPAEAAPAPQFKNARGVGMFEFGSSEPEPKWRPPKSDGEVAIMGAGDGDRSPSITSLSTPPDTPDIEEVKQLNLPDAQPYVPTMECAICGQDVRLSLKEGFEDEFTQGKQMSYKWQQRFCRYHKQHEAEQLWKQRGYPELDWNGLERRMQKYHSHLRDVISDAKSSYYRDQLSERLKERSKTALQSMNSDGAKRGAYVGYYGPRGEKVMTDHIIAHLSDHLRQQARKDRLVAASGVSGGVSGFVQAVLVPELAEQLVREDMKVSTDDARTIIAESAELGDLLNPEVDEKISETVEVVE